MNSQCNSKNRHSPGRSAFSVFKKSSLLLVYCGIGALVIGCGSLIACPPGDGSEVLKVTAVFGAGYSFPPSWDASISSKGEVVQTYWDMDLERTVVRKFKLERDEVERLRKAIRQSRFFDLDRNYSDPTEDQTSRVLSIRLGRKTHRVSVYALEKLEENPGVKRFAQVWDEFLKLVPDPNREVKEPVNDAEGAPGLD